jgi:hypothetical protein
VLTARAITGALKVIRQDIVGSFEGATMGTHVTGLGVELDDTSPLRDRLLSTRDLKAWGIAAKLDFRDFGGTLAWLRVLRKGPRFYRIGQRIFYRESDLIVWVESGFTARLHVYGEPEVTRTDLEIRTAMRKAAKQTAAE